MKIENYKLRIRTRGFTLIEMLVAISIFSIVILVAVGALLSLARASDRSIAVIAAIHNLDYAMEQMSRTLRVSTKYYCDVTEVHPISPLNPKNCEYPNGQGAISFTDKDGKRKEYIFNAGRGSLDRIDLSDPKQPTFAITSPEIFIESVVFNVSGTGAGSDEQPRVMIRVSGVTQIPSIPAIDQVPFDLQTTIVERNPENI